LLTEIQKTDLAITQQRLRFTDDSPIIEKLLLQRAEQLNLLQAEGQRALAGNSAQLNGTGESLLKEGQLGESDLKSASKLLELQTTLEGLAARDQVLIKKQQQLRAELDRFPKLLAKYSRLQPELQVKRETLQQLEKARQELSLEIARGGFEWQVVEAPKPGEIAGPKKIQTILVGAIVGLFLGGAAAFVRDMLDDSVHSSDELKQQVSLPLLGTTPELPQAKKSKSLLKLPLGKAEVSVDGMSEPIIKQPFGKPQGLAPWTIEVIHSPPDWESLDLIYKNIQLQNSVSAFSSLMITSALAGEGKSTIALGLAISAARLHQRVLLIDADLRQPTLHQHLNLPNEYGLSTLLESDATVPIPSSLHSSDLYIDILTSGPIPTDPVSLLSSSRMKELMAAFEQTYDLVLLNAPPVLGMVDALLAASYCQGVVFIARIDGVTKTALTEAITMLNKLNMIGVIANGGSRPRKGRLTEQG
jgi:capsular exopolysaccharide synthesis family protein